MVALVLFIVAMIAPELRTVMLVGSFCAVGGFMVGSQQTAKHDAELHANRAERVSMQRVEA